MEFPELEFSRDATERLDAPQNYPISAHFTRKNPMGAAPDEIRRLMPEALGTGREPS